MPSAMFPRSLRSSANATFARRYPDFVPQSNRVPEMSTPFVGLDEWQGFNRAFLGTPEVHRERSASLAGWSG